MSGPNRMILWGASGHARVLRECMGHAGVGLVAIFDNDPGVRPPFPDVPLYVGPEGFARWKSERGAESLSAIGFLVAIGGERGRDRVEIQTWLAREGLVPLTAVHPTAFVAASASIGEGSHVLAQSAVCVDARLGPSCIVNTGATIDHECVLGAGVHVAPGAHLAGCVEVESLCLIGTGASILPRVRIGTGAIVGAGAVVIQDVRPYQVVVGNPSRVVNARRTSK